MTRRCFDRDRWAPLALLALLVATPPTPARADAKLDEAGPALALASPIPMDPAVIVGRLDNGVTYYVRENHKPENRAELRLVIDAGSVLEDEDQRGLAHFVEHMAFNGTRNFAKQELVSYLERIGMRFGADVNAYTSFDETVYLLELPTDDEEIFVRGFQILEDWAHQVSFEAEEIDQERGVVVEEWRLGRGAGGRIRDRQLPVLFHGSRYAERLPIGDREVLESAPHDALRRFYRDWYRPDLMAVVAVGTFDPADVVERIERHFGSIAGPEEPRPRVEFDIPSHEEPLTAIVTDPEATSIDLSVVFKRPAEPMRTVGDLRRALVDDLYDSMMIARLSELTLQADPPYQYGFAASGSLGRTRSMYQLFAGVRDGGVLRGLRALLTEARRAERHGFTESELARAKVELLRSVERLYEERDKRPSARYAGTYVQHFLDGEARPSVTFLRQAFEALVPGITLSEVDARAAQWITDENRVILVSGPDSEEAAIPGEEAVLGVFDQVAELAVTPWVDRTRDEPLVAREPTPGTIVAEERVESVGTTRWTLSNGAVVLLKPTDFKNDQVLLAGYSPGGHSLVDDEDYVSATQAAALVDEMGLGSFDRVELDKKLSGKVAGVAAYIGEISEGVGGSASPKDLETLFRLLHLELTAPRRDPEAFASYRTTMRGLLENREASPAFWFRKKWNEVAFGDHPRRRLFTLDTLDEVDLDRALAVYSDRFADASDFVFTLVGSFEVDVVRPLVERWMASLPAMRRAESWRDVGAYADPGEHRFRVRRGLEPKSQVQLVFHGFAEWSPLAEHLASSMASALRIRLRDVLREDLGGVYGVGVYSNLSRFPRGRYNSGISFGCDPERSAELIEAVFAEIERLQREGPSQDLVDRVREIERRARETALEENGFWLAELQAHAIHGLPLADILDHESMVEAVTVDSIRAAAHRYLDRTSYILGVLDPAAGEPEGVEPSQETPTEARVDSAL